MLKNITLSADENLIRKARERAMRERRSLNQVFREWLARYATKYRNNDYLALMKQLEHIDAGKHFTRDEMNER